MTDLRYLSRWMLAVAALAVSVLACGSASAPPGVKNVKVLHLAYSEADTLDPTQESGSAAGLVGNLFSGLVRLRPDMQLIAELAESWDVSPDGRVYTFHLRRGVTFHDGRAFSAEDVRYSWERALDPATESQTGPLYLADIVGALDVTQGSATSLQGLRVVDDYTLEVTLDAPKSYFLYKIAMPAAWVVDQDTIDLIDDEPNGTGPFKLAEHVKDQFYRLARNPDYYLDPPALDEIYYDEAADSPLRMYETGLVDVAYINHDLLPRALDPADPLYGNVQEIYSLCSGFVRFDLAQPPFEDPLVRLAFTLAADHRRYVEILSSGASVAVAGLYPAGLPGFNPDLAIPTYDPQLAAEALSNSTYRDAANLPPISLTTYGGVNPSDSLLAQMWQEALGVTVAIEPVEGDSYYDRLLAGTNGQLVPGGWCADYPDPENFAGILFQSDSYWNRPRYSNPEFDALLAHAAAEPDITARMKEYQKAEQMLIDDSAAIFLGSAQSYYLVTRPTVSGYLASPIGVAQMADVDLIQP